MMGAYLLGFARVGPALLLLPLPGPRWARLLWALVLSLAVLPGGPAAPALPLLGREVMVGAALGICAAVPILAASAAGLVFSGEGRVAELWGWLALVLFLALSGPEAVLAALGRSYELFPLGPGAPPLAFLPGVLLLCGRFFWLGMLLAAAPLIALLSAQLLLSLALRAHVLRHGTDGLFAPLRALALFGVLLLLSGLLLSGLLARPLARLPAELAGVLRSL